MDGASDQADATFQRLLNREILLSERRRMLILAALLAFILALILLATTFAPGFVRSIYHDRLPVHEALAAFSAFIAYELFAAGLLTIFIRRGRNFPILGRYINALIETSFPTVLLYSPRWLSLRACRFRDVARAALFSLHHSLDLAARFCALGLHRRGRRGRALRPCLGHPASYLANRRHEFQHRLSSDPQRRPSRGGPPGRRRRGDNQEPFQARARRRLGPRRSDQPLRPACLTASGRASACNRCGRAQRNEAGLHHVC